MCVLGPGNNSQRGRGMPETAERFRETRHPATLGRICAHKAEHQSIDVRVRYEG